MRKTILAGLAALTFCSTALAVDIGCHGKVVFAMADHPGCTDANGKRQMAFKTVAWSNPWMCAKTDLASSMVLAATISNKQLNVYISDQGNGHTCSNLPGYSKVSYIILPNS